MAQKNVLEDSSDYNNNLLKIKNIELKLHDLEEDKSWAISRKREYINIHKSLKNKPKTQIWTVDFTKIQPATNIKFDDFVLVIATKDELKLSESIISINSTEPTHLKNVFVECETKKKEELN